MNPKLYIAFIGILYAICLILFTIYSDIVYGIWAIITMLTIIIIIITDKLGDK